MPKQSGCLSRQYVKVLLPLIYGPLFQHSTKHWNATVQGLAQNVLKLYMDVDMNLFDAYGKNASLSSVIIVM